MILRRPVAALTAVLAVLTMSATAATGSSVPVPPTPVALSAGSPADVGVTPDDAGDLYRGTGGLVIAEHDWRRGSGRAEAAGCADCEWRISVLCTKAQAAAGLCRRVALGCPIGSVAVRVWLRRGGGDWADLGQACQGEQAPRTVADVGASIRDEALALLPALRPAAEPAAAALVGVPVAFRTGQPAAGLRGADLSVLGLDVRLDARSRWEWLFGDGAAPSWTSSPGGRYPDLSVSHTYRRGGTPTATVTAVWRGQFTVEGLGPFPVPGAPLTQVGTVGVTVREARAVLVG